jgi:hypothetical protein
MWIVAAGLYMCAMNKDGLNIVSMNQDFKQRKTTGPQLYHKHN